MQCANGCLPTSSLRKMSRIFYLFLGERDNKDTKQMAWQGGPMLVVEVMRK